MTSAPAIPSTVASMFDAFRNCRTITSMPAIPDSVTNMRNSFRTCVNMVTPANLGTSTSSALLDVNNAFNGCTSLTGSMRIWTNAIANINMIGMFNGTTASKSVSVPTLGSSNAQRNTRNAAIVNAQSRIDGRNGVTVSLF